VKKRIHIISTVVILTLILLMSVKQLAAEFYYRMAERHGEGLRKPTGYLRKCIALDNKNALFHFSLGKAFLQGGLAEATSLAERNRWVREAIYEFHEAIKLEPSESDYHFHLGISYGCLIYPPPFLGKMVQKSFTRTAMLNPTDIRHLNSMAGYYLDEYVRLKDGGAHIVGTSENYVIMAKENYQLYFRKLLDVDENYLRKILEKTFSVTQLYTDLRGVIRDTAGDHAFFARFLDGKGMWKEAQEEYREAINLEPANPSHYGNFAHAFFRRGDYGNAIYWWGKQKAVDPNDGKSYLHLANSYIKLKRFDDALRELRELIRLHPDNINYQAKLIKALLAAGRPDEAIEEYHTIMGNDHYFSKTTYDAIREYQRKGNYPQATRILNDALSSALSR